MFVIFAMGLITGVLAVMGLLRLTMTENPTGCILTVGTLLVGLLALVVILLW